MAKHGVELNTLKDCFQFLEWLQSNGPKSKVVNAFVRKLRSYYQINPQFKVQLQAQYTKFLRNVTRLCTKLLSDEITTLGSYKVETRDENHILDALLECTPKFLAALYYLQYHVDVTFRDVGGGDWAGIDLNNGPIMKFLTTNYAIMNGGFIAGELNNVKGSALVGDLRKVLNKDATRRNSAYDHFRNVILTTLEKPWNNFNTGNAVLLVNAFCRLVNDERDPNGGDFKAALEKGLGNEICWQALKDRCHLLHGHINKLTDAGFSFTCRAIIPKEHVKLATEAAKWFSAKLPTAAEVLKGMIPPSIRSTAALQTFAKDHLYPNGFIFDGSEPSVWPSSTMLNKWDPAFQKFQQLHGTLLTLKRILDGEPCSSQAPPPKPRPRPAPAPRPPRPARPAPPPRPATPTTDNSSGAQGSRGNLHTQPTTAVRASGAGGGRGATGAGGGQGTVRAQSAVPAPPQPVQTQKNTQSHSQPSPTSAAEPSAPQILSAPKISTPGNKISFPAPPKLEPPPVEVPEAPKEVVPENKVAKDLSAPETTHLAAAKTEPTKTEAVKIEGAQNQGKKAEGAQNQGKKAEGAQNQGKKAEGAQNQGKKVEGDLSAASSQAAPHQPSGVSRSDPGSSGAPGSSSGQGTGHQTAYGGADQRSGQSPQSRAADSNTESSATALASGNSGDGGDGRAPGKKPHYQCPDDMPEVYLGFQSGGKYCVRKKKFKERIPHDRVWEEAQARKRESQFRADVQKETRLDGHTTDLKELSSQLPIDDSTHPVNPLEGIVAPEYTARIRQSDHQHEQRLAAYDKDMDRQSLRLQQLGKYSQDQNAKIESLHNQHQQSVQQILDAIQQTQRDTITSGLKTKMVKPSTNKFHPIAVPMGYPIKPPKLPNAPQYSTREDVDVIGTPIHNIKTKLHQPPLPPIDPPNPRRPQPNINLEIEKRSKPEYIFQDEMHNDEHMPVDFIDPAYPNDIHLGQISLPLLPDMEMEFDRHATSNPPATITLNTMADLNTCRNPWDVPTLSTSPASTALSPPPATDHLPPPKTVREMLYWFVGFNTYGLIGQIKDCVESILVESNHAAFKFPYALEVTRDPYQLAASMVTDKLTETCLYSAVVIYKIKYTDSFDAYETFFKDPDKYAFYYSSDPSALLCQLRDYVYACHHQLAFLKSQCNRDSKHGGWQDCKYGSDLNPPSPLQSFLTDGWDCPFKTHLFDQCNLCLKSRIRMGFRDEDLPSSQQTGNTLSSILTPSCGGEDPLLTLSSYLNCLTRRTPRTTGELVSYFHHFGNELHKYAFNSLLPLGSSLTKSHPDCPYWDCLGASDLQAVSGIRWSKTLHTIHNSKHEHSRTLSTLLGCDITNVQCTKLLSPITNRAYALYSQSFVHTYLSWAVYLPDRLHESLQKLHYDLQKHRGSSKCSSLHLCSTALPLLYTHGFTPPGVGPQQAFKCSDVMAKLEEIVNGKPIASLITAMDNFLYGIREPFIFTLVALWFVALLLFANTMLYRLDVLRIRSHLTRSRGSHVIDVKALLTDGTKMPSLYDIDYFDEDVLSQFVVQ